jgi:hypothetical protein
MKYSDSVVFVVFHFIRFTVSFYSSSSVVYEKTLIKRHEICTVINRCMLVYLTLSCIDKTMILVLNTYADAMLYVRIRRYDLSLASLVFMFLYYTRFSIKFFILISFSTNFRKKLLAKFKCKR